MAVSSLELTGPTLDSNALIALKRGERLRAAGNLDALEEGVRPPRGQQRSVSWLTCRRNLEMSGRLQSTIEGLERQMGSPVRPLRFSASRTHPLGNKLNRSLESGGRAQ